MGKTDENVLPHFSWILLSDSKVKIQNRKI